MKFKDYSKKLTYKTLPQEESDRKLAELILYISDQCIDDEYYGATKLNKILYHSDFISYRLYKKSITAVKYQRLAEGPAPKRLIPVREKMLKNNELLIKRREVWDKDQHRYVALRESNLDLFSAREISIVDQVIKFLWNKTASEASKTTHGIAWEIYANQELMPYESVLLSNELDYDDIARAHQLIKEHGWDE